MNFVKKSFQTNYFRCNLVFIEIINKKNSHLRFSVRQNELEYLYLPTVGKSKQRL